MTTVNHPARRASQPAFPVVNVGYALFALALVLALFAVVPQLDLSAQAACQQTAIGDIALCAGP